MSTDPKFSKNLTNHTLCFYSVIKWDKIEKSGIKWFLGFLRREHNVPGY